MKTCRKCGATKPLDEFHKQSRSRDGHQSRCKDCAIALARQWYEANKDRVLAGQKARRDADPDQYKTYLREYYRKNKHKWVETPELAERRRERAAARRSTPEGLANAKRWYRSYYDNGGRERYIENAMRRRNREREVVRYLFTERDWRRLVARQLGCCFYCGERASLTRDHVVPIARGGTHGPGNIVAACKPCNSRKRHRFVMEWRVGSWKAVA